jgi:tetratricopeptide (TPR) repeat protein
MYYHEGAYDRALDRYRRALVYYEYAFADSIREQFALHRVRLSCLLNSSVCYSQLQKGDECVGALSQALDLCRELAADASKALEDLAAASGISAARTFDVPYIIEQRQFCETARIKALYRRARAQYLIHDYDAAEDDCTAAEDSLRDLRRATASAAESARSTPSQEGPAGAGRSTLGVGLDEFAAAGDDEDACPLSAAQQGGGDTSADSSAPLLFAQQAAHQLFALRTAITEAREKHADTERRIARAMFDRPPAAHLKATTE